MDKPTIGHYASHQRDVTAQEGSALNAALRSSTVKVEHPEIARLRAELAKLSRNDLPGMCEAFARVIEAYHSKAHPFHNPVAADARVALRVLRGICSTITALALEETKCKTH